MLWFWGLGGAFIYAGPRLIVCIQQHQTWGERFGCIVEFLVSIGIGIFAAEGVGPYVAATLHQTQEHQVRALAVVVGLLANPVAPGIVKLMSAQPMLKAILKSLGGKP